MLRFVWRPFLRNLPPVVPDEPSSDAGSGRVGRTSQPDSGSKAESTSDVRDS
jgi:hypothetical protein